MPWTMLNFGKHKGKTLPQVLFTDPDWFFWAAEEKAMWWGNVPLAEVEKIRRRATSIKIPQTGPEKLVAEYLAHRTAKRFANVKAVPESQPQHQGSTRLDVFDLSFARTYAAYDKTGCKSLVKAVKFYLFGSKSYHMTKDRCETFFENDANFVL